MQIVGFLNGKNKNYDYQLTAASRAVMTGGVLGTSDLLVTSGSVTAGSALIEVVRTNGQKVLVHFENTDAFPIATTGTAKIYVLVDQAKIDDGTANAPDGTGIATIASGASYPASNFIPLASIASGVITDERVAVSLRNVKRKGMTAKRVLVVDASGNETELSGTEGQAVVFDASGNPLAMTPSMNISGLPAATAFSDSDEYIKYDAAASANRKVPATTAKREIGSYFFWDGSDGDITVSAGTTTLSATSDEVFKQYKNLTISGGTLACSGKLNHIYVSDTLTISGTGKIHADGYGGAGGTGGSTSAQTGANGTNGNGIDWSTVSGRDFYAGALSAGAGNNASSAAGNGGASGTFKANERGRMIRISVGAGGGGAGCTALNAGAGGTGGNGGGVLIIIANRVNITGGTVSANGANGTNGNVFGHGGGGGGGGGSIVMLYGTLVSDTGTWQCNGGNGGNGHVGGLYSATGGAGGGGWFGIAGGNGGAVNTGAGNGGNGVTPANNSYGNGGTGGTGATYSANTYASGGGGGGAPGVYYKAKARIN